jgi:outer membrane protein assembly factor BamE (lipoprotein component of BamABCDE complex)
MSKDGVRIALGYPAIHRTPSLDSDTWTYWHHRHRRALIQFDEDGKVIRIDY